MTTTQRELARHALGLPCHTGVTSRNHFCAGPGHSDYVTWQDMVAEGLAIRKQGNDISGMDDIFWLTRDAALSVLDKKERLGESFRC